MRFLLSFIFGLIFISNGYAQQTISMSVENCAMSSSSEIQFDVFITNNGVAAVGFNAAVIRLTHGAGILPVGGSVSWGYVTGSSTDFSLSFPPSSSLNFDYRSDSRELSVSLLTNVYSNGNTCSAPQIGVGVKKKIGRFYLQNTLPWVIGQPVNLAWSSTSGAVLYVNCASTLTNFNVPENRTLVAPCSLTTCAVSTSSSSVTACGSYFWTSGNGQTYTSSGNYIYSHNNGAGCLLVDTLHLVINNCNSYVNVTLFLEGYYLSNGTMQSVLWQQGVSASLTDVDSVTVELHNNSAPYAIVASAKGLLQTNGTMSLTYPALTGNYYLAVKYKNAVETWSKDPVAISAEDTTLYNFTTAANKAYGDNMIQVETGKWAFYSGDLNQDENIDLSDYALWETDNNNFESGYFLTDLNGDGNVDLNDYSIWENNNNSFISAVHP